MVDKSKYEPDDDPFGIDMPIGTIMKEFMLDILTWKHRKYICAALLAVALVVAAVTIGGLMS